MKKLILSAAFLAGVAATGVASAQSADCARGMLGGDPCGANGVVIPHANYSTGEGMYGPYGPRGYWPSQVFGTPVIPPAVIQPRVARDDNARQRDRDRDGVRDNRDRNGDGVRDNRANRDRDGDGVPNNQDRFPGDATRR